MLCELRADEIRTFIECKKRVKWALTAIEVWSRLWLWVVLGRRSYKSVMRLLEEATHPSRFDSPSLVATDGYRYCGIVLGRVLGRGCIHGRVVKTHRKNRLTKVERDLSIGSDWQLEHSVRRSEDSDRLNTAFVERPNLTVRRACAHLQRRSPAHARSQECLAQQLELLRCHYNFIRPHGGLKFGREVRTPATQAGPTDRKPTFRDVFTAVAAFVLLAAVLQRVRCRPVAGLAAAA